MEKRFGPYTLFDLSGARALITGGASYLGAAITSALFHAGAEVIVASRNVKRNTDFCLSLDPSGIRAKAVTLDIRSLESIRACALSLENSINILINNASCATGGRIEQLSLEAWNSAFEGNVTGYFLCAREFSSRMMTDRKGSIINVGSILGMRGIDAFAFDENEYLPVNYATAKGAVISLTQALASEWAYHGVRVNSIIPGAFTPPSRLHSTEHRQALCKRIPMRRIGEPTDIAGAALFLASDASAYVTGQNIVIDGGWTLW